MTPLILIDGNNFAYRAQATASPMTTFVNEVKIQRATGLYPVIIWDGAYAKKYRQGLCPVYKSKRKPPADNIYAYMDIIKEALAYVPCSQMSLKGYEADDLIAYLCRSDAVSVKFINSTDRDLSRLSVPMYPTSYHCFNPKVEVVRKTLVGDQSDNLPGIRGFGDAAWRGLPPRYAETLNIYFGTRHKPEDLPEDKWTKKILDQWEALQSYYNVIQFRSVGTSKPNVVVGINKPDKLMELERKQWLL